MRRRHDGIHNDLLERFVVRAMLVHTARIECAVCWRRYNAGDATLADPRVRYVIQPEELVGVDWRTSRRLRGAAAKRHYTTKHPEVKLS